MNITDFFNNVRARIESIQSGYSKIIGSFGGLLYVKGEGRVDVEFDTPLKLTPAIVENETDAELSRGFAESFENVFNNWLRISRSSSPTHNTTGDINTLIANYDETQSWAYDESLDRIRSEINSSTLIGFISPQPIDTYTAEVILRSTNGDDDSIGMCIALAYDNDGIPHTLDVMRNLCGTAPMTINKDRTVNTLTIANVFDGLYWPNGEVATGSLPGNETAGWAGFPDGTKLKITRVGDIITIETSDIYSPTTYLSSARTVIDLNSSSDLEVFKGPQQWGYLAQSQSEATWEVLQRPVERGGVFNASTNTLWEWDNDGWVENTGLDIGDVLKPGRFYFNQVLGKLDYYDPDTREIVNVNLQ